MAFPIGEKTLLDFNANIGATVTVPLHLGYWMADEEISGSYRINSLHFMNVTSPVAFSLVGGIGGHARYGKFVFGLDLNFGKMKFDVQRETDTFTFDISNDNLVNVENTSTTTKEALRITSLRFKISMGW